jgi:hypothetical protein
LLFVLAAQVVLSVLIVTQDLMEELRTTENKVAFARQHFSDAVTAYSVERESFPTVFLAEAFKYKEAELFEVELERPLKLPFPDGGFPSALLSSQKQIDTPDFFECQDASPMRAPWSVQVREHAPIFSQHFYP